jgi:epoxyqueuosine reductase
MTPHDPPNLGDRIRDQALGLGFEAVGFAPLRPSDHAAFYQDWLARGRHGDMAYLARPDAVAARLDPTDRWPELRSAVVVAHHYATSTSTSDAGTGVIARYARGRDYHRVVKNKLLALLRFIEEETGEALPAARAYVDTGPVLERELARRAGLGWFGRNTMLIDPQRGSYFFLGSLLLPFELAHDAPFEADRCGTCTACLEACPTGALLGRDENGAPVMDARLCISYLTIENRGAIPRELRPAIGNRIYGCDVCQEVCPFSIKFSAPCGDPSYAARAPGEPPAGVEPAGSSAWHPGTESPSLVDLFRMALDEDSWELFSRGSAVRRAGREGFARNVAVALGNWGDPSAVPVLSHGLNDPHPLVRAHAAWALGQIGSAEALSLLRERLPVETGPVLEEIERALGSRSPNLK